MFERRERLTAKNLVTLQIATRALQGELLLPGGTRARKHSLADNLVEMAQGDGENTSAEYRNLLALTLKKHQEVNTSKSLKSLVEVYENYAFHLSVLRLYYYYCSQQASTKQEKMQYAQLAQDRSRELLQQMDAVLVLYSDNQDSEEYKEALDKKNKYTDLDGAINSRLDEVSTKKRKVISDESYTSKIMFLGTGPVVAQKDNSDTSIVEKITNSMK